MSIGGEVSSPYVWVYLSFLTCSDSGVTSAKGERVKENLDIHKIEAQAADAGLFVFADRVFEQLDEANGLFPNLSMTVELRPFQYFEGARDPSPSGFRGYREFSDYKDSFIDDVLYLLAYRSEEVPHVYCSVNPRDHEGHLNRYKYERPGGNEATPAVFNIAQDLDFKHGHTEESRKEQLRN